MPKVFISHTHSDKEIADAINEAITNLFGNNIVEVVYSTKSENEGGIKHGADWFKWIIQQVSEADVTFVLLTTGSVQKPWIMWEAGAVEGVVMASHSKEDELEQRRVRPLVFNLKSSEIPTPFHRLHAARGDRKTDVKNFLRDLIVQFGKILKDDIDLFAAGTRLDETVKTYLDRVYFALRKAPLMVTEAAVQEWLKRIELFESRPSEIDQLHDWMNLTFGRDDEDQDRPLDLRIHRRIGELFIKKGTIESSHRAIREFELARLLSPRDIFILRELGNAFIATDEFDKAWSVIEEIEQLDAKAYIRSPECAALKGKWLRKKNNPSEAVKVYDRALQYNSDSYYLATIAAESSMEDKNRDKAIEYYSISLKIIERLNESNIWAWASATNACLAKGDIEKAKKYLTKIANTETTNNELNSIEGGIERICANFDFSDELIEELKYILRE